jgi:TnpA family transposase
LFMLLGYRFFPRLADLGDTRFYRVNPNAHYGPLNGIARHRVNTEHIARHWDDLLRVAGSLKLGVVSAHDLMRTFQGSGRNSSLARALPSMAISARRSTCSIWPMMRCTVAAC